MAAASTSATVAGAATREAGETRGRSAGFVVGFDGLRAIAALLVVVVHVGFASGYTFRSSLGRYTARGEIGVSVFFLISGFLLYRPFAAAALSGRAAPNVRSYLVRRALRIVPLYWVALVVTYLFTGWKSVYGVSGFLEHAFFLQVYSSHWVLHGITQAWSLCIEVTFYLLLPVWAAWMRRLDRSRGRAHDPAAVLRRELAALAVLYVASILFRLWVVAAPTGPTQTARSWLPAWSDHFALGMALAVTGAYVNQTGTVPKVLRWLAKPGADLLSWVVAAFMFWLVATQVGLSTNPLGVDGAGTDVARQILYGLFALFLLLPAVFGTPRRGVVRRLLASHVLSLIGLVSYGIYLWHQLVVRELQAHTSWKLFDAPFLPLLAAAVVVVIAVSTVSYLFVERPGIAVGHRWLLRQREQAAVHTPHESRSTLP
jgi:peptidoglycan/LPS O-acetylase OafA/YrhL